MRQIRAGNVIAYPTESVFGLGCDPLNEAAVLQLLTLKRRDPAKGLILVAANLAQLAPYITLTASQQKRIETATDPTTWLVTPNPHIPNWLTGSHNRLAIRISTHPTVQALSQKFQSPIISTSANTSGKPAAKRTWQVTKRVGKLLYIVTDSVGNLASPTAIIDVDSLQRIR